MPDLWFVAGLAFGVAVSGFCAIGSFDRGADSVRRRAWTTEIAARQKATIVSRRREGAVVARGNARQGVTQLPDRVRRANTSAGAVAQL